MKIDIDDDIGMLTLAMKTTLANHQKEKGDSWKTCDINFLKEKLDEEYQEWKETENRHELVDIANICMMLFNREIWKVNDITYDDLMKSNIFDRR